MTGLDASFTREVSRTLRAIGAERWAVASDAAGPFSTFSPIAANSAADIGGTPVMILRETIQVGSTTRDLIVMGVVPSQLGSPSATRGSSLAGPGQIVIDRSLQVPVGGTITFGSKDFHVVGSVSKQTLYAGIPLVYIALIDAQEIATLKQPLATAMLFRDAPATLPAGMRSLTNAEVKDDVLRPLQQARASVSFVRLLLWLVAGIVVGSVLYLQALERTRDFAVFKATGTSTMAIGAGLALQAVMLSLSAAVIAAILGSLLAPLFPLDAAIPRSAYLLLPVITVVVGLLACSIALRRTARIDPAMAFGG
jgi:putative ABC transport system permease protein